MCSGFGCNFHKGSTEDSQVHQGRPGNLHFNPAPQKTEGVKHQLIQSGKSEFPPRKYLRKYTILASSAIQNLVSFLLKHGSFRTLICPFLPPRQRKIFSPPHQCLSLRHICKEYQVYFFRSRMELLKIAALLCLQQIVKRALNCA